MDIHLADHTAVYRRVVWENHIEMIKDGKSYKFGNVTVRTFNAAKYISLGENCVIEEIDDIENVIDDEVPEDGVRRANVVKADIVGNVDTYKSCRSCNGKIIESDAPIGLCSKCNSKMKIARCIDHRVVNVLLLDENDKEYKVTIFNDIIDQILMLSTDATNDGSEDIADKLLNAPVLYYTINQKDIVSSVST